MLLNLKRRGEVQGLTGSGIYKRVLALAKRVGVKTPPHGLRHTAITRALDLTGGNVRMVKGFSRHANLETLQVYDDARRDFFGQVARMVTKDLMEGLRWS